MIRWQLHVRPKDMTALEDAVSMWESSGAKIVEVRDLPNGNRGVQLEGNDVSVAFYVGCAFQREVQRMRATEVINLLNEGVRT